MFNYGDRERLEQLIEEKDALEYFVFMQAFDDGDRIELVSTFTNDLPYGQRTKGGKFLQAMNAKGFDLLQKLIFELKNMVLNEDLPGIQEILDESSDELVELLTTKVEGLSEYNKQSESN